MSHFLLAHWCVAMGLSVIGNFASQGPWLTRTSTDRFWVFKFHSYCSLFILAFPPSHGILEDGDTGGSQRSMPLRTQVRWQFRRSRIHVPHALLREAYRAGPIPAFTAVMWIHIWGLDTYTHYS